MKASTHGSRVYSYDDILDALRRAAGDVGEPLTKVKYDAWRHEHPGVPSAIRIIQVAGSWIAACTDAGVGTGPSGGMPPRWTREQVVTFMAAFLNNPNTTSTTYQAYGDWAKGIGKAPDGALTRAGNPRSATQRPNIVPSPQTVRNTLGNWTDAKIEAAEFTSSVLCDVSRFLAESTSDSEEAYTRWVDEQEEGAVASLTTVNSVFYEFAEAKQAASRLEVDAIRDVADFLADGKERSARAYDAWAVRHAAASRETLIGLYGGWSEAKRLASEDVRA